MKKIVTLFTVLTWLCYSVNAQTAITLTQADFGSIGDTVVMANDTLPSPGISVGPSGASQSWSFTNIQVIYIDTIKFVDPSTLPNSSDFPGSNLAMQLTYQDIYLKSSASEVDIDGAAGDFFGTGSYEPINFDPTQSMLRFPTDYLNSYSDTAVWDTTFEDTFSGTFDSIRVKQTYFLDVEIDGYGQLTTPGGTYDSTLRQFNYEIQVDSIWGLYFGSWMLLEDYMDTDTSYSYAWWTNGEDLPLLEIEADTTGGEAISINFQITDKVAAIAYSPTNVSCNSLCDGSATVQGMSGAGSYNYQWDDTNSQTTPTATGLCAGTYNVTVTDAANDTARATVVITEPAVLTSTINVNNHVRCKGGSDGSATVSTSGGTPFYSFNWSAGGNSTVNSNLPAGEHSVTVTDQNGCTSTSSVTITEPATELVVDITNVTAATDGSTNDGSATANPSGGDGPYSYVWSNNETGATANALPAGEATVAVTDANGCTVTDTVGIFIVSIKELQALQQIKVYPNPADEAIYISGNSGKKIMVSVFDLLGKEVSSTVINGASRLDVSGLQNGTYFLRIKSEDAVIAKKISVIR